MVSTSLINRIAAVDIGSNTLQLVIADVRGDGSELTIVARQTELVRLGADVSASGRIGPVKAAHAEKTLRSMAQLARKHRAIRLLGMATEGVRAASNADELLARFSKALGVPIVLLSGLEEAALAFWGATSAVVGPRGRLGVADLGGGSCELVVGEDGLIVWARSLPLGSGRLIDAVNPSDPPTPGDMARLKDLARAQLAALAPPQPAIMTLVAIGGTATNMARIPAAGPLEHMSKDDLDQVIHVLSSHPASQIARERGIELERVRLLVGGSIAWREILTWLDIGALDVSERGIREGAIVAWAKAGDTWQTLARHAAQGMNRLPG